MFFVRKKSSQIQRIYFADLRDEKKRSFVSLPNKKRLSKGGHR